MPSKSAKAIIQSSIVHLRETAKNLRYRVAKVRLKDVPDLLDQIADEIAEDAKASAVIDEDGY